MTLRINKWFLTGAATLALVLFFVVGGLAGYVYGRTDAGDGQTAAALATDMSNGSTADKDLWKPFFETYNHLNKEYYGRPIDKKKLVDAAAQGMISSLGDPYTSYLPPQQEQMVRNEMRGKFEGIGVYADVKNKQFTIVSAIEGSPAEKAGLRSGDVIIAVNGESITGMEQSAVITKIRGPKGTSVTLKIKRGNQVPFDVKVTRDEIDVKQVTYKLVGRDVAYISANIFGDKTTGELDKAIQQAQADGAKGIVLDLRDNGGGWVNAALEMLGRFIPNGVGMYEDPTQGPGGEKALNVRPGKVKAHDLPMVVLVNNGSASASEIVAGALQARGRAKLVGDVTFGKGSEQSVHTLTGGSSAHITIAHWLTPDKRDIHGKGLQPDVLLKSSPRDKDGEGPQFQRAVELVRSMIK